MLLKKKQQPKQRDSRSDVPPSIASGTRQLSEAEVLSTLELSCVAHEQQAKAQVRGKIAPTKKVGAYNSISKRVKVKGSTERITINMKDGLYDEKTLRTSQF